MTSVSSVRDRRTAPRSPSAIIMERTDTLARFSESDGLTRLYLTPEHKAAAALVAEWMRLAGMTAEIDAVGNVVGRYAAATAGARTLIIGSHIDTVRNAGRYDGNLGVVVGIQAVAELAARHERLPFAVEVIAFGDEEGVRFPVTLTGSHAVAGTLDPNALDVRDDDGITLREALKDFGCDLAKVAAIGRRREAVLGYVEVHIEQGPVLETENLPVGVVSAIAGASRLKVTVRGVAGHAGTVPMHLRKDAVAAAAEMVLAVERIARDQADLVGTVGRIEVTPSAPNVIPSQAVFTIDLRSPSDTKRTHALAALNDAFAVIAARRTVKVEVVPFYDEAAAPCAPFLMNAFDAAVAQHGVRPRRLSSGAGHDGLAMIKLCPIAMLFVRCAGGVSHNPAESVTVADVETALDVLVTFLRRLDPAQSELRP